MNDKLHVKPHKKDLVGTAASIHHVEEGEGKVAQHSSMSSFKDAGWSPASLKAAFSLDKTPGRKQDENRDVNAATTPVAKCIDLKVTPKALRATTAPLSPPVAPPCPCSLLPGAINYSQILINNAQLDSPLSNGWYLYEHQKEAIRSCLIQERTILAYDMGLGKTLIGLKWAHTICSTFHDCFAVMIAPCTLLETWAREAEIVGLSAVNLNESLPEKLEESSPIVLFASWAKVRHVLRFIKLNMTRNSPFKRFVLMADEAHAMQNIGSERTKAMIELSSSSLCVGCILATGTPMKNGRPSNLYPLLRAIRHPIAQNKIAFEKRYCNARKTKFSAWDITGAANLHELKEKVDASMLRKTKEDCLELPPVVREKVVVSVRPVYIRQYQQLAARYPNSKHGNGRGSGSYSSKDLIRGGANFEVVSKIRQLSSLCKVEGTGEYIVDTWRSDSSGAAPLTCHRDSFVVFVWYKQTAQLLKQYLEGKCHARTRAEHYDMEYMPIFEEEQRDKTTEVGGTIRLASKATVEDLSGDEDKDEEEEEREKEKEKRNSSSSSSSSSDNSAVDGGGGQVVFYADIEAAAYIKALQVRCACLTGDLVQSERQQLVDSFQQGEIDVIVCTYGVGSTGLTLTRSHRVVLLDRPWTPGDVLQAEDRVRRIGQKADAVCSTWVCALEQHDEKMDAMLRGKDLNSGKVVYRGDVGKRGWFDTTVCNKTRGGKSEGRKVKATDRDTHGAIASTTSNRDRSNSSGTLEAFFARQCQLVDLT